MVSEQQRVTGGRPKQNAGRREGRKGPRHKNTKKQQHREESRALEELPRSGFTSAPPP
jgi:hypothetical protein